jgi:phenylacetate-CoA ligase
LYELQELVSLVRERSPFFKEFYKDVPRDVSLYDLPVIDQSAYWPANTIRDNTVLTGPMHDGIVFYSGGTTGNPKFSIFSEEEFQEFTRALGRGMCASGLAAGDKIANMFRAGQLYASFVIMSRAFELGPEPVLQFPITAMTPHADALGVIADFGIDVIAGFVTSVINIAEYYDEHRDEYPGIEIKKVFYTGEALYPDQRTRLEKIFPGVRIRSLLYASVDAGMLGWASPDCDNNEHRPFPETIFEIVDEDTDEPLTETEKPGRVLVTNLTRLTMPIIRYPVGDRAVWVEPEGAKDRKYRLAGRSGEAARLASENVYYDDIRALLDSRREQLGISSHQIFLRRIDGIDAMVLRIAAAAPPEELAAHTDALVEELFAARPGIRDLVRMKRAQVPQIEWAKSDEMLINQRTGKLRRIIDERTAG